MILETHFFLLLFTSALRISTPLIFAALGGFFCERSGVIDISLEGKMIIGAFTGACVAHATGSPWLGFVAAGISGVFTAFIYGIFTLQFSANQIVAGTAINLLAAGLCPFLANIIFETPSSTPALSLSERFEIFPVWAAWFCVGGVFLWLRITRSGRWVVFAGEHALSLESAGISIKKVRWGSMLVGGFLAGLSGASLSLFLSSSYSRNMTGGRGFMALAALILGKWRPLPAALACGMFGVLEVVQTQVQNGSLIQKTHIPIQFVQILPYIFTILISAGFLGRSQAPKELGIPLENKN